jgi:hypothetical protein
MKTIALRVITLTLVALAMVNCRAGDARRRAEAAVETFHGQLNDDRFSDIYSAATPAFQASGTRAGLDAYLGGVRRILGAFKADQLHVWNVMSTPSGMLVALTYESQFDQDSAVEEFTFAIDNNRAVLQRYNINSRTLVAR